MPRTYRTHRRKVKGCYECSQRRINCDRAEPSCAKCLSKGLKCSGLGIRYRFSKYAAIRGNWAGKTINDVYGKERLFWLVKDITQSSNQLKRSVSFDTVWKPQSASTLVKKALGRPRATTHPAEHDITAKVSGPQGPQEPTPSVQSFSYTYRYVASLDCANNMTGSNAAYVSSALIQPEPDGLRPWKSMLLLYFSKRIAREMVAVDGPHNGWRHIVLPLARTNGLVMDAVMAVSSFHLSVNRGGEVSFQTAQANAKYCTLSSAESLCPEELYLRAIQGLQRRQDIAACFEEERLAILLSILVLQIAVMVTGSTDFPILFRMMESVLEAMGGECQLGSGELSRFMVRQIHKMRVYGAPFISEENGLEMLSSEQHTLQMFDCLNYCAQQQPNASSNVPLIRKLVRQAHKIYLRQAQSHNQLGLLLSTTAVAPFGLFSSQKESPLAPSLSESVELVQQYKETLEAFPPGSIGEEVLTWATFIAASDCILTEHMSFFEDVILRYYARSGFVNVLAGLEYLRHIWKERSSDIRWTSVLPLMRVVVM